MWFRQQADAPFAYRLATAVKIWKMGVSQQAAADACKVSLPMVNKAVKGQVQSVKTKYDMKKRLQKNKALACAGCGKAPSLCNCEISKARRRLKDYIEPQEVDVDTACSTVVDETEHDLVVVCDRWPTVT